MLNTLFLACVFLGLFGSAEVLYHFLHVKAELSRKYVHVFTGLLTLLFPIYLDDQIWVLLLCSSFAILLFCSKRFGWLPSINAIDRDSAGSLIYPVAVYGSYLVYWYHRSSPQDHPYFWFYTPVLLMAICDPIAALVGKRFPLGRFRIGKDHKSLAGTLAFFTTACLLSFFLLYYLGDPNPVSSIVFSSVLLGAGTATIEAVSIKGIDNLSIPLVAILEMIALHSFNLL